MSAARDFVLAIIGGGLVGGAIAYGLARRGQRVALLDEGDIACARRAATSGWCGCRARAGHSRLRALDAALGAPLRRARGDLRDDRHRRAPRAARRLLLCCPTRARRARRGDGGCSRSPASAYVSRSLDHAGVARFFPGIGPGVVGATLLVARRARQSAEALSRTARRRCIARGGIYARTCGRNELVRDGSAFAWRRARGAYRASRRARRGPRQRAARAAGRPHGAGAAAARPDPRARARRAVSCTTRRTLRQTDEGSVLIGDSQEEVGFDDGDRLPMLATLAERARAHVPAAARCAHRAHLGRAARHESRRLPGLRAIGAASGRVRRDLPLAASRSPPPTRCALAPWHRRRRSGPGFSALSSERARMFRRLPDFAAGGAAARLRFDIDGGAARGAGGRHRRRGAARGRRCRLPHDARLRRAARAVLHDGRVLRLPRRDRRRAEPAGLPDHGRATACASSGRRRARRAEVAAGDRARRTPGDSISPSSARGRPAWRPRRSGGAVAFDRAARRAASPGGQIYRGVDAHARATARRPRRRLSGAAPSLVERMRASAARYVAAPQVWSVIEPDDDGFAARRCREWRRAHSCGRAT